jgi:ATP-dependent DNA helicase RecQ
MSTAAPATEDHLLAELRRHFDLPGFRPGQREVIDAVLAGRDALCIMPTGSGKSLCYQLPAMLREGVTLVVSPLIALMADQVRSLEARGLPATFINSSLDPDEQDQRLRAVEAGRYKIVFVAPERFRHGRFNAAMAAVRVGLFAVDEAHCISEWGHDFRPDYRRLQEARDRLGRPPTLALTATATAQVRADISRELALADPFTVVTGFDRPNLTYEVVRCGDEGEKREVLKQLLVQIGLTDPQRPGSGIIYVATKKPIEDIGALLHSAGVPFVVYHGTLEPEARKEAQRAFMAGRARVAVATNAFGMGVDKPDVRAVIHYHCPGSVEAYYQEAGRAGRDGHPSRCVMLFGEGDRYIQEFFIEGSYPERETVAEVYEHLRRQPAAVAASAQRIAEHIRSTRNGMAVETSLRLLEDADIILRERSKMELAALRFLQPADARKMLAGLKAGAVRAVLATLLQMAGDTADAKAYFNRDQLAGTLGYSPGTLADALAKIKDKTACEYTPAYRGSRARVLKPDLNPDRLPIDFKTLEKRAAMERGKLDTMIGFARSEGCRRRRILTYFGEKTDGPCGSCDQCRAAGAAPGAKLVQRGASSKSAPPAPKIAEDPFTAARKFLACIARVEERGMKVGRGLIVSVLTGGRDETLLKLGLDKLSTFGLLREVPRAAVEGLGDQLLAEGCLRTEMPQPNRPVLTLTDRGWRVMQDKERIEVSWSAAAAVSKKASPPGATFRLTWDLVRAGKGLAEIAEQRSLAASTIEEHILRGLREGVLADIRPWVSEALERKIRDLLSAHPDEPAKDLLERCPVGTTYFHLRCVKDLDRRTAPVAAAG